MSEPSASIDLPAPPERPRLGVGWSLLILFGTAACVLDAVLITLERAVGSPSDSVVHHLALGCALAQAQAAGCYLAMGQGGLTLRGACWLLLCWLAAIASPLRYEMRVGAFLLHSLSTAAPLALGRLRGWRWAGFEDAGGSGKQFRLGQLFALTTLIAVLLASFRWNPTDMGRTWLLALQLLLFVPLASGLFALVFRVANPLVIALAYVALALLPVVVISLMEEGFNQVALRIGLIDGAVLLAAFGVVQACGYRIEKTPPGGGSEGEAAEARGSPPNSP